ncbi:MAG: ABC transporter ATP-binding protein, partial [Microbacteriaceae bacterium]
MAKSDEELIAKIESDRVKRNQSKAKFSQLLPYLAEHKKVLSFVLVLGVLGAGASLAQPLIIYELINRVQLQTPFGALIWALIVVVLVSTLLGTFEHYFLQRTGEGVVLSARKHLVSRMLRLPVAEFDSRRVGDLVSRVGADTTLLRAVLTQGTVEALGGAVTFIGAVVAMLILDALLLGLTVLVIAVAIIAVVLMSLQIRTASRMTQERVGDLAASVERAISAVRTIRASNANEREEVGIMENARGAYRAGLKVAKISALITPIAGLALQASFLVVLGVGGFRVASGETSIASLVAFLMFLFMMIMPLGQAFGAFSAINQALGALGRINEIIALPSEDEGDEVLQTMVDRVSDTQPATKSASLATSLPAIEFRNLVFHYPDSAHKTEDEKTIAEALAASHADDAEDVDPEEAARQTPRRPVLDGVSFEVPRGKRTALVGPSGAGKSTILALIERFYDPTSGEVLLGGTDIRKLDRRILRSKLGYVEQDAPVLAGSIRDSLLLAAPNASDKDCVRVLAEVNLLDVLERDPAGLSAQLGEDGVLLSGGERQRLALARILLSAPPILLLDESTSNLDGLNEQRLQEAIDRVSTERTLLVIAHRL